MCKIIKDYGCFICHKLSTNPKVCNVCWKYFCPKCLALHLNTVDEFCPACHLNNKEFPDLPKNMRFLLAPIKVKCHNADMGCTETPGIFNLAEHTSECDKCFDC